MLAEQTLFKCTIFLGTKIAGSLLVPIPGQYIDFNV